MYIPRVIRNLGVMIIILPQQYTFFCKKRKKKPYVSFICPKMSICESMIFPKPLIKNYGKHDRVLNGGSRFNIKTQGKYIITTENNGRIQILLAIPFFILFESSYVSHNSTIIIKA